MNCEEIEQEWTINNPAEIINDISDLYYEVADW